jgi:hypothetical protein
MVWREIKGIRGIYYKLIPASMLGNGWRIFSSSIYAKTPRLFLKHPESSADR